MNMKKLLFSTILMLCYVVSFAGDWINIGKDARQTFYINDNIMDEDNNHIVWLQKTYISSEARNYVMKKFHLKRIPYSEKNLIVFNYEWTQIATKRTIFYNSKGDVIESIGNEYADLEYIVPDSNGEFWRDEAKKIYDKKNNNSTASSNTNGHVFTVVEQMPQFPGGDAALMGYIRDTMHYPTIAKENGVQGRVVVSFVVEKDGSITNVAVLRSVGPSLDREAIRIVRSMPRWIPGKQNGHTVSVKYQVPVTFRL